MLQRTASRILLALMAVALLPAAPASSQQLREEHLAALDYREIGPTRQSGRFVDIAVRPDEPFTFYIATGSGHLWKSDNRGQTFDVLFENEDVYSIGAVALAPSRPDVMYLGTGEANNSRSTYWGNGVYKSTDAGETWTHVGLPESHHIGRIVVHPTNPDVVYVAALGHLYSENPERGVYRSRNGGQSWEQVLAPVVRGKTIGAVDIAMDPSNPNVLYAATFDKVRVPWSYDLGGPGSRVYKSTNGGDNWEMLTNGLPQGVLGRIGIDIADSNPNIVYLTVENANKPGVSLEDRLRELDTHQSSNGMIGGEIYRSDDAGASWRKTHSDDQDIGGGPAYYYGQIIVDPNDPDVVHVLSAASWGSRDGGVTWERRPLGFGGDDHTLWIDPDDSDHMILGYDHGMGITYDGGENWYHPDFQSLAQFYAVGYDMSYPYRVAGGLQDNGSHMAYHTNPAGGPMGFEMWERVGGGDGMYNEFDTCTNRYLYNESQFGPLQRHDLWTGESQGIRYDGEGLRFNWNAPIQVSPHDCDVILHASNKVLRSPNRGESWEVISPDLSKANPVTLATGRGGDGNIQYATITSMEESALVPGLIWVGTDDGNLQVTRDGGANWTLLNANVPGNPECWVSRVEPSRHDPAEAFVSYTCMRRDNFRPYVYRTADYGQTWTSIASNLPQTGPVNVVRQHHQNPDLLFVGTDFQVFTSIDRGRTWVSMKNDMPTNPAYDMKIHPRENDLIVATHGRGIYIADIAPLAELTPQVLASGAHFFQPEDRVRWIADNRMNTSSSNFRGESEPQGMQLYYYLGRPASGDVTFTVYQGAMPVAEIQAEESAGLHEVLWNMEVRRERTAAEQEEMRNRFGGRGNQNPEALRWATADAPIGTYRVVMSVGGTAVAERRVSIRKDEWWMNRR